MKTTSTTRSAAEVRSVDPAFRPSPDQPPRWRIIAGIACLISGFVGVFSGGIISLASPLCILGFMLVLTGMFFLRVFRFGTSPRGNDHDLRKLYGRNNA